MDIKLKEDQIRELEMKVQVRWFLKKIRVIISIKLIKK